MTDRPVPKTHPAVPPPRPKTPIKSPKPKPSRSGDDNRRPVPRSTPPKPAAANTDDPQLNQFLHAIVVQESGGNYNAKGVVVRSGDRAYGKYQIMGANIPAWSREILGKTITISQFMASPELQDKIAIGKLTKYYQQFGPRGAAVAWYAGPGNVKNHMSTKSQYGGPSIKAYADSVVNRMGKMPKTYPGVGAPSAGAPAADVPTLALGASGGRAPGAAAPVTTQGIVGGNAPLPGAGTGVNGKMTANDFGFAASFFNSDPELKKTLQAAIAGDWTAEKFAVEFQKTKWYRTHAPSAREWIALNHNDPGGARRKVEMVAADIHRLALESGAEVTGIEAHDLAVKFLEEGWSQQELTKRVGAHVEFKRDEPWRGEAGVNATSLKQKAAAFGVPMNADQVARWVRDFATQVKSETDFDNWVKEQAKILFPALGSQIDRGLTPEDVAQLYTRQMAEVLEIDPARIEWAKDPLIQRALSSKSPDSKEASAMPLWAFEQELKKDPRWLQTNNASNSFMGVAGQVLKDWGLKS